MLSQPFVIRQAGAGDYFQNGQTLASFTTKAEAELAMAKMVAGGHWGKRPMRVEDWTPTAAQLESYRAEQE